MKEPMKNNSGIAGIWHSDHAASKLYLALHSIQHRGSDGAGIAAANGESVKLFRGLGMLSEALDQNELNNLDATNAIGQVRMLVKGDRGIANVQPIMVRAHQGNFALVTMGSITNSEKLRHEMEQDGLIFQGTSDAELIAHLVQKNSGHLFEKITKATSELEGAYAFLLMTKNTMYAFVSASGVHPLYIGKLGEDGLIFSSESASFGLVGAAPFGKVESGQLIRLGKEDNQSFDVEEAKAPGLCLKEFVYYSKPDSVHNGKTVHVVRKNFGKLLAKDETIDADIVVGVPDTAMSAASGFAQALGKPYEMGLIKNRYIGSTFVKPTTQQRKDGIRVRLNAISSVVKGKRVYLVDDSLCKGFTAKRLSQLLREAGAKEVHMRIACPKTVKACFYGSNDYETESLASARYTDEELCQLFDLDSIRFLDIEDFLSCTGSGCMECMTKGETNV